jgi:hypothetical protein
MNAHRESSDDVSTITGGHATSMELAEVIEEVAAEVTSEGLEGDEARHTIVERVVERVGDPTAHAVVAAHVHARFDLG